MSPRRSSESFLVFCSASLPLFQKVNNIATNGEFETITVSTPGASIYVKNNNIIHRNNNKHNSKNSININNATSFDNIKHVADSNGFMESYQDDGNICGGHTNALAAFKYLSKHCKSDYNLNLNCKKTKILLGKTGDIAISIRRAAIYNELLQLDNCDVTRNVMIHLARLDVNDDDVVALATESLEDSDVEIAQYSLYKCYVIQTYFSQLSDVNYGVTLSGSPHGSNGFVESQLAVKFTELEHASSILETFPNKQNTMEYVVLDTEQKN